MNSSKLFLFLLFSAGVALCQINITGKVVDTLGNPIRGAYVSLAVAGLKDTTDSTGQFVLSSISTGNPSSKNISLLLGNPFIKNHILFFAVPQSGSQVTADVFSVSGRLVAHVLNKTYSSGNFSMDLASLLQNASRNAVYFVRLKIGNEAFTLRWAVIDATNARANGSSRSSWNSFSKKTALSDTGVGAFIDTLTISKTGYVGTKSYVSYSQTNLPNIVLASFQPLAGLSINVLGSSSGQVRVVATPDSIQVADSIRPYIASDICYAIENAGQDSVSFDISFNGDSASSLPGTFPLMYLQGGDTNSSSVVFSNTSNINIVKAHICLAKDGLGKRSSQLLINSGLKINVVRVLFRKIDETLAKTGLLGIRYTESGNPNSDTIMVFVHGINDNGTMWDPVAVPYKQNYRLIYVSYSWGLHISSNGKALKEMLDNIPGIQNAKAIFFVTHSMGGLVARKCLSEAVNAGSPWVSKASKLILFSSPSDGGQLFYLQLGPVGKVLSNICSGLFDLMNGYMNEQDWNYDDAYMQNRKTPVPLPNATTPFAVVCGSDPFVETASAFDTKDKKDDLHLPGSVNYQANLNCVVDRAVILTGNTCSSNLFHLENYYNYVFDPATGIILQVVKNDISYVNCLISLHGTYKWPEGEKLLACWLGIGSAPTAPSAPVISSVVSGDGSATVSWGAVTGATSYNLYYATGATVTISGTKLTGVTSPKQVTGLTDGTQYAFAVSAVNAGGESGLSNIVTATPNLVDIDGNIYHAVPIGTQVWMVENLKTTKYNDGSAIPLVTDNTAWGALVTPGYCWYNNDLVTYGNTYGALYNWYAVSTGKLAPTGWHVPSDAEWEVLGTYLGGDAVAGGPLKETGTAHWISPNTGATNSSGFSALPGGYRDTNGSFNNIGNGGLWWSSTAYGATTSWYLYIFYNSAGVYLFTNFSADGFSVRCVRDN